MEAAERPEYDQEHEQWPGMHVALLLYYGAYEDFGGHESKSVSTKVQTRLLSAHDFPFPCVDGPPRPPPPDMPTSGFGEDVYGRHCWN